MMHVASRALYTDYKKQNKNKTKQKITKISTAFYERSTIFKMGSYRLFFTKKVNFYLKFL